MSGKESAGTRGSRLQESQFGREVALWRGGQPVEALAPLVRSFTLPGELVLDPFAGSGSTCAAACLAGRRYIGVELDTEYFHQASARLERIQERIAARERPSQVLIPTMR
jgi:site-specific DNA-methyltransferase (adenine-specific)